MTEEKVLVVGDSLTGATGFSVNGANICWSLAKDYDVHYLGLQSFKDTELELDIEGEKRKIIHHANQPRGEDRYDFGQRSLPVLLEELEPEVLLTINDIQMIRHVPDVMCPRQIQLPIIDLPSKKFVSDESLKRKLEGEVQKFKERYPRDTKWIAYCPQDGDPPMNQWSYIYSMADKTVAMSKYGKKVFKDYFNMDVPYIWHGVDSTTFYPDEKPEKIEDKFVVGNFNRNQPRKQPVRAIEGFAKFAKDKDDVLLHMQMDWNDIFGWPLKYFTDLYGVSHKCIQPGKVGMPREEVARIYNAWDVNLMTTGGEGFGLCFAESMMCGVPNIACDYTTSRELIDDGWLRPRGLFADHQLHWQKMDVAAVRRSLVDPDSLSDKLNEYYYNRDKLQKHSENSAKWAKKNLSIKKQQKQWRDLVKDTLNEE
jgi:glycosyltransferase involved in cell wall biosynthesis